MYIAVFKVNDLSWRRILSKATPILGTGLTICRFPFFFCVMSSVKNCVCCKVTLSKQYISLRSLINWKLKFGDQSCIKMCHCITVSIMNIFTFYQFEDYRWLNFTFRNRANILCILPRMMHIIISQTLCIIMWLQKHYWNLSMEHYQIQNTYFIIECMCSLILCKVTLRV